MHSSGLFMTPLILVMNIFCYSNLKLSSFPVSTQFFFWDDMVKELCGLDKNNFFCTISSRLKFSSQAGCWSLIPVILATQEAEISKMFKVSQGK
jgi:hypothetical protein